MDVLALDLSAFSLAVGLDEGLFTIFIKFTVTLQTDEDVILIYQNIPTFLGRNNKTGRSAKGSQEHFDSCRY